MTTEQKARAYDEVRKKIAIRFGSNVADEIFSQFEMSEDERIRESLLEYLHTLPNHYAHSGVCTTEWIAWLEKQGEQKPVDKVVPKFHEGEWLCENEPNNYARFIQILEIVNVQGKDRYRISRDIHKDEDVVEFGYVEKYYHKFDIKDAKDGDVLHSPSLRLIWIYKDSEHYHACVNMNYVTENVATNSLVSIPKDVCPANRVQRSILFQKMEESNYKLDAAKKELKEIEQKPAWSEEDECYMSECIGAIATKDGWSFEEKRKTKHWLKSLKDRVQPKSQWKPSDEQMIRNVQNDYHNRLGAGIITQAYHDKVISWLKSLSFKNKWKPSDEQMEALKNTIHIKPFENPSDNPLWELYEQLKKHYL